MKRAYVAPIIEKITFNYKIQTTGSKKCFESVMNERDPNSSSTTCVSGTTISMGWNEDQTLV